MGSTVPGTTGMGTDWRVVDGVATAWFAGDRTRLRRQHIVVREEPIARLVGTTRGGMRCVEFTDGTYLERSALFLHPPQEQRSSLAADLGARLNSKGVDESGIGLRGA